jgi:protein TonB
MDLRCFLFSSDQGTAANLRQILSGLGVEAESCADAVAAVERITSQPFQLVIIDWDQQPESALLLNTARQRKAADRPLTLAIVSNDADAPKALHAGANSLLRKPVVVSQARETLTTARDLLGTKQGATGNVPRAAVVPAAPPSTLLPAPTSQTTLRAGDFLQGASPTPGGLFEAETGVPGLSEESSHEISPLKDLEPVASAVAEERTPESVAPPPGAARGLEWYLKNRAAGQPSGASAAAAAPAPVLPTAPKTTPKPELLGYEQTSSYAPAPVQAAPGVDHTPKGRQPIVPEHREQKKEAELFAYIQGEQKSGSSGQAASGFGLAKRAIVPAFLLAVIAIIAAPQAPWHSHLQGFWRSGRQTIHAWLNPQPATPTQAPIAHETFTRPGDEYKLPVAEPIPDATTDPSQIEVVPVIDPTVKKPNNPQGGNAMDPSAVPAEGPSSQADTPGVTPTTPNLDSQPQNTKADPFRPTVVPANAAPQPVASVIESPIATHSEPSSAASAAAPTIASPKPVQPRPASTPGVIPQSLKSQLAPANTMIGGNKPADSVPPPIEPVVVPESSVRALILESSAPAYPATAKGQQGSVVLQVLVARDGSVQDAKFMQGSLLFARNAIDAVRQWKFKPYSINGHPVSVLTQITIRFKPAQ